MSTKSSALFPASKGLKAPSNLCPELITSQIPPSAPGKVILKNRPGHSLSLSLRALNLAKDLPLIYEWMMHGYPGSIPADPPVQQLSQAYSSILASDFAQPYIGQVNDVPICQMDIYRTRMDVISLCYESLPGDYGLHLLNAPQATQDHQAGLLGAAVRYFFSFPEVGRLVTDVEAGDEWMNTLMKRLGFQHHKKIKKPYKIANLYICTRQSFTGSAE